MTWYICFFLSAVLAAALVVIAFTRRLGVMRVFYAMLALLLAAYLIYIPPFFHEYSPTAALFGGLINVLQVISLDADYGAFYDLISAELHGGAFAQLYFFLLAAIHFLLPTVSAMSAITLVARCLTRMQLGLIRLRKRPLYIFSEINSRSVSLARDIRAHEKRCDILFLSDGDGPDPGELRRELGCRVLNEKVETVRTAAPGRTVHYYCISSDEEQNLNTALSIRSFLADKSPAIQRCSHIFLFSTDPTAALIMDSVTNGLVNLSIINEHQAAVYDLLERRPLVDSAVDGNISVLICGFTPLSEAFLRAAVWCGQLDGYRLSFTVLGENIRNLAANFQAGHPGLFTDRYDIRFFSYENELEFQTLVSEHCRNANYIMVSGRDEDETIDKSVYLRRFFYRSDPQFRAAPPIFAYISNGEKAAAVANLRTAEAKPERSMFYDITPFGMLDDIYSYRYISASGLEGLSRNIHLVYEDIFSQTDIDVADALQRYNLFEVNKGSNRANALHIRYKLAMLGLDYTDEKDAVEVNFDDFLTEEVLDRLTVAEHDRWMAFLESEGWSTATVEESKAYQVSGVSKGRHNCPLLNLHPYICPFDELPERSDKLGLPDSTVYDRELIARIPDILHDKWGVSGKRYKIIQRARREESIHERTE